MATRYTDRPRLPITEDWIRDVHEAAKERGTLAEMARVLGVRQSQINGVLDGRLQTSTLVRPISAYLGIPEPVTGDDRELELVRLGRQLDDEDYEHVLEGIRHLVRRSQKPDADT